jgi:alkylation response protein AidB-like acyl-CoA dehydrogenase
MIDFALDDEQEQLRQTVRSLLTKRSPLSGVRRFADDVTADVDRDLWTEMCTQMGLASLAIPEQYGGSGFGFVAQAVVLEEMGRVVYPGPYFSSAVLAAQVILATASEDAKQRLLPGIASGDVVATVAAVESEQRFALECGGTIADASTLSGVKVAVPDARWADVFVVYATGPDGAGLYEVAAQATGVSISDDEPMDPSRPVATVTFDRAPATVIASGAGVSDALQRGFDIAAIGLACEQAGTAATALDMATEYAKARHQFGRPIGSFQAIKHMLADVYVDNESAWSAAFYGAWAVDHAPGEVPMLAPLASAFASDAVVSAAETNIQVHGGIGFTWEHDAQFPVRRAFGTRQLVGAPDSHRDRIAETLLGA